jgi:hypothetical protein
MTETYLAYLIIENESSLVYFGCDFAIYFGIAI